MKAARGHSGNIRIRRSLDHTVPVEIDRSLDPNFKLARVLSVAIYQTYGIHARRTTVRLSLFPKHDRIGILGSYTGALQCTLVGDSSNNEQWSDGLPSISSHCTGPEIAAMGKHKPEPQRG